MPQISKIRIVNFYFNNSRRLIPDELFDLSDSDGIKALDTLISLINGGGKSVLVQLMMQPVLPGARVQKRRIEDYFTKPSDHSFVLLEWIKDDSPEKMLTGIAMAGSQSDNSESKRGRHIRYYTFCTHYTDRSNGLNIIDLPLSDNVDGKFVAADYESIRKLSKKNDAIVIYNSDENKQWRDKLEQYDIFQEEWEGIMEPLNSQEGGMSEFFKEFRTSDQLIDSLLIPAIENHLSRGNSKKENSLVGIFTKYVKKYSTMSKRLEERKLCERYTSDITALQTNVQELWNIYDKRITIISRLYGFKAALNSKLDSLSKIIETLSTQIDALSSKLRHIDYEQLSDEYYSVKEKADEESQKLIDSQNKENELKIKFDSVSHDLLIQQAARHYAKKRSAENEIAAHKALLKDKEQGNESKTLNLLGASVKKYVSTELEATAEEAKELEAAIRENSTKLEEAKAIKGKAESVKIETHSEYDRKDGIYSGYCEETDRKLGKLMIDVIRNHFTNCYDESEIITYIKNCEKATEKITEEINTNRDNINKVTEDLMQIPIRKVELLNKQKEHQAELDCAVDEHNKFRDANEKMLGICAQYSLSEECRFTERVKTYLNEQLILLQGKIRKTNILLQIQEEEIRAAQSGYLHIPKTVINFLEETGIEYNYCEKYFLEQIKKGNLSSEECIRILHAFPAAAYGIMLDDENMAILKNCRPDWLPSVLPIFSMHDMENIINMTFDSINVIAYFSEESFRDRDNYIETLATKHSDTTKTTHLLEDEEKLINEQLEICEIFVYDKDWEDKQNQHIKGLEEQLKEDENLLTDLIDDAEKLRDEKANLDQKNTTLQSEYSTEQKKLEVLREITERIKQESFLYDSKDTAYKAYEKALSELEEATNTLSSIQDINKDLLEKEDANSKLIKELKEALQKVEHCISDEIVEGNWKDLLAQYEELLSTQNESIRVLNEKIQDRMRTFSEEEAEILQIDCSPDEYENVLYDEEKEHAFRTDKNYFHSELEKQMEITKNIIASEAKAKTKLETITERLSEFGGQPLEKSAIKRDYTNRRDAIGKQKTQLIETKASSDKEQRSIERLSDRVADNLQSIMPVERSSTVSLETDIQKQWEEYYKEYTAITVNSEEKHTKLVKTLKELWADYPDSVERNAIHSMSEMLGLDSGDVYMSLDSQMDAALHASSLRLQKITTDLEDFDNTRNDLILQCKLQGQRIYQGLCDIAKSAKIKLADTRTKQELIRFILPENVDEKISLFTISEELDKSVKELAVQLESGDLSEEKLEKVAAKTVSSSTLLRRYIGQEQIGLRAYKFDSDTSLRDYRTWESTAVDNSGAEKFLVYFAVILSLIHYARNETGAIGIKESSGVLILDNPFGVITSQHALDAMFKMVKHFNVQLICLSDITKCDITSCFSIHIKAAIKTNSLSNISILSHEGNEHIEHGYCRAVQITL